MEKKDIVFIQPPVTSLVPNNPAGLTSLMKSIDVPYAYRDLNEEFFLDWCLSEDVLIEVANKVRSSVAMQRLAEEKGLTEGRISELCTTTSIIRSQLPLLETYTDFEKFLVVKKFISDAVKLVSIPTEVGAHREKVIFARNTVDYSHAQNRESRASYLQIAQDENGLFRNYVRQKAASILEHNPALVAISVTHPDQYPVAFQLAMQIRHDSPAVMTLLGGNTVTRRFDTWSQNDELNNTIFRCSRADQTGVFDALVVSEGEIAIQMISRRLHEDLQEVFGDVPGIIFKRKDSGIVMNDLPVNFAPEKIWVPGEHVFSQLTRGFMPEAHGVYSIVNGRICTYECANGGCKFCAISKGYLENVKTIKQDPDALGKKRVIVQRSLGSKLLAKEIKDAVDHGFSIIDITDEQFTLDQALELSQELQAIGVRAESFGYSCYMRIDATGDPVDYKKKYGKDLSELMVDPEILKKLYSGGMRFAQFGLETTYDAKIKSMKKGTSQDKIAKFGNILKALTAHGIMPHVFVIAGTPLEPDFEMPENAYIGRTMTTNDLEILEAFSNLNFLYEHRSSIFTIKHTQFKLAKDSPLAVGRGNDDGGRDLSANLQFRYLPGLGPSNQLLKDLLRLYDLWKQEVMPYQAITSTYMYCQRLLPGLGASGIQSISENQKAELSDEQIAEKKLILKRLWRHLVGNEYADKISKPSNSSLQRSLNELIAKHPILQYFPQPFSDYTDIYRLVENLKSRS